METRGSVKRKRQQSLIIGKKIVKKKFKFQNEMIYENVKEAIDKKLIKDLNNQTYFKNDDGTYPSLLYAALDNYDIELIHFLLDNGINPNIFVPGRRSFLREVSRMLVNKRETFDIVKKLIKAGVDINNDCILPQYGYARPLAFFIGELNPKVAEFLINEGADVEPPCTNPDEWCSCNPFQLAVQTKMTNIIDLLLEKGVNVNNFCRKKYPPFYYAVLHRDIELMKRLLDLGADVNVVDYHFLEEFKYRTALHLAIENDDLKAVQLLLDYELTDVNIINLNNDFSILHNAVYRNSVNCIDELLNADVDVNLISNERGDYQIAVEMLYDHKSILGEKLKKHIIKLRAAGYYLNERNLAAVSEKKYKYLYIKCCHEVDAMKTTTISPKSHVNFHDLLFMTHQKLALCLESLDNQEILQSGFQNEFRLYAGMIEFKLKKAYRWLKLKEELYVAVDSLFNQDLPCTIMEQIFSYFSAADLVELRRYRLKDELNRSKSGQ